MEHETCRYRESDPRHFIIALLVNHTTHTPLHHLQYRAPEFKKLNSKQISLKSIDDTMGVLLESKYLNNDVHMCLSI